MRTGEACSTPFASPIRSVQLARAHALADHGSWAHAAILPDAPPSPFALARVCSWYETLMKHVLPHMQPYVGPDSQRCVLILDGASIHRNQRVVDACFRHGVMLYYLPPYCPILNPIEDAFKQAKNFLRINNQTLRDHEPEEQMKMAFSSIQPAGARGAFRKNGPWL